MSRSLKKGPFVDQRLIEKIKKTDKNSKTAIKTWARYSVVSPEMIGYTLGIHNGKIHIPVLITEEMVGHRLGEFAKSRKFVKHGGRIAKEEEMAAGAKAAAPATETSATPKASSES